MGDLHAGLVVIGGGGSGLAAAASAVEAGVKDVLVLEKAGTPGGNTRNTVCLFGLDSPTQRRLGVQVDKDALFRAHMDYGHWKSDPRLVRVWFDRSGEVIGWLEDKGARLDRLVLPDKPTTHQTSDPPETKRPGPGGYNQLGRGIVRALTKSCDRLGIQILCGTAATKISTDRKGRVSGVLASGKDGEFKIVTTSAVVATGGFANNREMRAKYFPRHKNAYTHSLPQMTGDGIVLARDAGAQIDEENMVIELFGPHYLPHSIAVSMMGWHGVVVWVNKNGERFVDESISVTRQANERGHSLGRQPGDVAYILMDTAMEQEFLSDKTPSAEKLIWFGQEDWTRTFTDDIQKGVKGKRIKISGSWDEIARWMGADPAVLRATIDRYNSFCDAGYDSDFAKDSSYLKPLRQPPYIAVLARQGIDTTHGGIKISPRMEAYGVDGKPIGGLYAAGDTVEGVESDAYDFLTMAGNSLSWALVSGYVAGENVAAYLKDRPE